MNAGSKLDLAPLNNEVKSSGISEEIPQSDPNILKDDKQYLNQNITNQGQSLNNKIEIFDEKN